MGPCDQGYINLGFFIIVSFSVILTFVFQIQLVLMIFFESSFVS